MWKLEQPNIIIAPKLDDDTPKAYKAIRPPKSIENRELRERKEDKAACDKLIQEIIPEAEWNTVFCFDHNSDWNLDTVSWYEDRNQDGIDDFNWYKTKPERFPFPNTLWKNMSKDPE